MSDKEKVIGLVGSPNKDGLTNRLVSKALEGAMNAGQAIEHIYISDYIVNACHDCLPPVCDKNLKCTYDDENFEVISKKILGCKALVLGTPVYLGETSAMIKLLITKMVRVFALSGALHGLPALGIAIAGETGNGLINGLRPLYNFFRIMRFKAIEPLPVTRFNLKEAEKTAEDSGYRIAKMSETTQAFRSREESQLWYDNLPYLSDSLNAESRLLASITVEAVPEDRKAEINGSLARADLLATSGKILESMLEISKVYNSCVALIDRKTD